jgi:hypothetical protein
MTLAYVVRSSSGMLLGNGALHGFVALTLSLVVGCAPFASADDVTVAPETTPAPGMQDGRTDDLASAPSTTDSSALTLTRIDPSNVTVGAAPRGLEMTLTGRGFANGSRVASGVDVWRALVVNDTTIKLTIPSDRLAVPGVLRLAVLSGVPETRSNELTLTVDGGASSLRLEPSSATARTTSGGSLSLVVHGEDFDPRSIVVFDGVDVPTTFQSATVLKAAVPDSLLGDPKQVAVVVRRASRVTSTQLFTVLTDEAGAALGTSCESRGRCSDTGMKVGECVGDFPSYRCGDDGCLTLVVSCWAF